VSKPPASVEELSAAVIAFLALSGCLLLASLWCSIRTEAFVMASDTKRNEQ